LDPTFWATVAGTVVATVAVFLAYRGLKEQLSQNYSIVGAQSAIEWRQQLIELHDRGLSAEQIRRIMLLEDGGVGYEEGNGRIDEILRDVPRRPPETLRSSPRTLNKHKLRSWRIHRS
jgi:hypothetical protein